MKLTIFKREGKAKSELKKIRYDGDIPAIIYQKRAPSLDIFIKGAEFDALLRGLNKGRLSTTILTLKEEKKEHKVIVKDIQYSSTNYKIMHVDFELIEKDPVTVNVPIELLSVAECKGIKEGGTMRQIIRTIKVRCMPKDIPSVVSLDVKDLGLLESKRLSDIELPKDVRPLARNLKEIVAIVAKR